MIFELRRPECGVWHLCATANATHLCPKRPPSLPSSTIHHPQGTNYIKTQKISIFSEINHTTFQTPWSTAQVSKIEKRKTTNRREQKCRHHWRPSVMKSRSEFSFLSSNRQFKKRFWRWWKSKHRGWRVWKSNRRYDSCFLKWYSESKFLRYLVLFLILFFLSCALA